MNGRPILSVVVTVSGRPDYFRETLASLHAQTFDGFELIVSDDSPWDTDRAAIRDATNAFAETHPCAVRYLFTQPKLGQAGNMNRGLEAAAGRYIRMLHDDDVLAANCLADEMAVLTEHGGAVEIVYSYPQPFTDVFEARRAEGHVLLPARTLLIETLCVATALPSALVFSRAAIDRGLRLPTDYHFLCDWRFFLDLVISEAKHDRSIARLNGRFLGWRQHEGSVTRTLWDVHHREHRDMIGRIAQEGILDHGFGFTDDEIERFFVRALDYRRQRLRQDTARQRPLSPDRMLTLVALLLDDCFSVPDPSRLVDRTEFWGLAVDTLQDHAEDIRPAELIEAFGRSADGAYASALRDLATAVAKQGQSSAASTAVRAAKLARVETGMAPAGEAQ